jgi:hypothetical protein
MHLKWSIPIPGYQCNSGGHPCYMKVWGGKLCHFLDHLMGHYLPVMITLFHNNEQNGSIDNDVFCSIVESAPPPHPSSPQDLNVMELSCPYPLCRVKCQVSMLARIIFAGVGSLWPNRSQLDL